jgi:SAM-dependent methyltransferase
MDERDRNETVERYRTRYEQFGYEPRTLGWNKGRQHVRFAAVLELIGRDFASIIDVGCGFGDLFGYLKEIGWRGEYIGYDICPELLDEGRKRFGPDGARFECVDFSSNAFDVRADVAVAIGVFNHKLQSDNWEFVRSTLAAMWKRTDVAIAADFLSATADKPHEHLFHVDAGRVLEHGLSLSRRASLKHDYMPFEFAMAVWHDDHFDPASPVFAPYQKHLADE